MEFVIRSFPVWHTQSVHKHKYYYYNVHNIFPVIYSNFHYIFPCFYLERIPYLCPCKSHDWLFWYKISEYKYIVFVLFLTIIYTIVIYRVIHKSLRDFRPLQYSSWDGHAEGEHVNRGRDAPSFCPASAIPGSRNLLTSVGSWQTFLTHARHSQPMAVSQRTGSQSAGISCTTHELFCP